MLLEHLQFIKMGRLAGLGWQVELGRAQAHSFAIHLVRDCLSHFYRLPTRIQYSDITGVTLLGVTALCDS